MTANQLTHELRPVTRGLLLAAFAGALCFGLHAEPARARVLPALGGMLDIDAPDTCFTFADSFPDIWGVYKNNFPACAASQYVIPILWDNPSFTREVDVLGRKNSSSSTLRCRALTFNPSGTLASQSALTDFTSTSFAYIQLFLSSVPAGSFGFVRCEMSSESSRTVIVNLDYAP